MVVFVGQELLDVVGKVEVEVAIIGLMMLVLDEYVGIIGGSES